MYVCTYIYVYRHAKVYNLKPLSPMHHKVFCKSAQTVLIDYDVYWLCWGAVISPGACNEV